MPHCEFSILRVRRPVLCSRSSCFTGIHNIMITADIDFEIHNNVAPTVKLRMAKPVQGIWTKVLADSVSSSNQVTGQVHMQYYYICYTCFITCFNVWAQIKGDSIRAEPSFTIKVDGADGEVEVNSLFQDDEKTRAGLKGEITGYSCTFSYTVSGPKMTVTINVNNL